MLYRATLPLIANCTDCTGPSASPRSISACPSHHQPNRSRRDAPSAAHPARKAVSIEEWQNERPTAFFRLGAYKIRLYCQNRLSERTFQRNLARKSPSDYAGVQNNHFLPHFARSLGRGAETFRRMLHLNPFNLHCPLLSHLFRIPFSSLSHLFPMPSITSSYGIFSWIRNSIGMSSGA